MTTCPVVQRSTPRDRRYRWYWILLHGGNVHHTILHGFYYTSGSCKVDRQTFRGLSFTKFALMCRRMSTTPQKKSNCRISCGFLPNRTTRSDMQTLRGALFVKAHPCETQATKTVEEFHTECSKEGLLTCAAHSHKIQEGNVVTAF